MAIPLVRAESTAWQTVVVAGAMTAPLPVSTNGGCDTAKSVRWHLFRQTAQGPCAQVKVWVGTQRAKAWTHVVTGLTS